MKTLTFALATLALSAAAVHADKVASREIKTAALSSPAIHHAKKVAKSHTGRLESVPTARSPAPDMRSDPKAEVK